MKKCALGVAVSAVVLTRASAIPTLQLDANPSRYVDGQEESIQATANPFELYALGEKQSEKFSLSSTYFLSVAITKEDDSPMTLADKNFGTFTISGVGVLGGSRTYSFSDLVFGNPPFEANIAKDNNDLPKHSIFPTYFAEIAFQFDPNKRAERYNTEDDPGELDPDPDGGLYYQNWTVNVTGLTSGYILHFDLYDAKVKSGGDIDVDNYAPFSHDAISGPSTSVPETSMSLALLGIALAGLGAFRYRFASQ